MREYLCNHCDFVEVETPTLFRRTPGVNSVSFRCFYWYFSFYSVAFVDVPNLKQGMKDVLWVYHICVYVPSSSFLVLIKFDDRVILLGRL